MSEDMKVLTRDDILSGSAEEVKIEKVWVPEWNGYVYVKEMTARELEEFEEAIAGDRRGEGLVRAALVAASVVDEKGKRLFSQDDVAELANRKGKALSRIFIVSQRLNSMGEEAERNFIENFDEGQGEDSSSV